MPLNWKSKTSKIGKRIFFPFGIRKMRRKIKYVNVDFFYKPKYKYLENVMLKIDNLVDNKWDSYGITVFILGFIKYENIQYQAA